MGIKRYRSFWFLSLRGVTASINIEHENIRKHSRQRGQFSSQSEHPSLLANAWTLRLLWYGCSFPEKLSALPLRFTYAGGWQTRQPQGWLRLFILESPNELLTIVTVLSGAYGKTFPICANAVLILSVLVMDRTQTWVRFLHTKLQDASRCFKCLQKASVW